MPIDPFKTQVLLLHGESNALHDLRSRFGDRYTVHFATSGSEALSTLADTPINVFISTQNLPGMSGREALREAKRRSPDTIGILLAGDAEDGDGAFVGDEELFYVVRGNVSGESLVRLVDDTARKMRLATLAESANDSRALGGSPRAQDAAAHSGESLSLTASGRMPALDPSVLKNVVPVDVLVLTSDERFRDTVRASSRGLHTVHSAATLREADALLRAEKIGVAVIDAAVARRKVEQLMQHMRREAPRLVVVVAGRSDDGEMLMDLVNRGRVYRFLVKPVTPGRARLALEAAAKHHLEAPEAAFQPADEDAAGETVPNAAGDAAAVAERMDDRDDAGAARESAAVAQAPAEPESAGEASRRERPAAEAPAEPPARGLALRWLGIGAAVSVALAAAWFFLPAGSPVETADVETATAAASITEADVTLPPTDDAGAATDPALLAAARADLLTAAREARDAGAIYEPDGENAIELYQAAVNGGAAAAAAELDEVIALALGLAEEALLASRLDDAERALGRVAIVSPDNVRLPFLLAQIDQARLRATLGGARDALRDGRLEDAARMLAEAEGLQVADRGEIDALSADLAGARSEQRVDKVLALADARLEAGDLLTPANRNARYYYELALSNDPDNQAARQGLNVVASRLILDARASIDKGDFRRAEMLLGEVRALDPQHGQLLATAQALDVERRRAQQERSAAEAKKAAESAAAQAAAVSEAAGENPEIPAAAGSDGAGEVAKNVVPVAVSTLGRTRYVAPKYPRSAQRRGISGWVELLFTVTTDGTVKDVVVHASEPRDLFDNAATRAVEKWEFEPVLENGAAIEQRAAVRMMFALE